MAQVKKEGLQTARKTIAQLLLCTGCCCGRTDRGNPPVPVAWIKNEWKMRGLLKSVHLTISGCLGPCDLVNVVGLVGNNETIWLGGLVHQQHFVALRDWAMETARIEEMAPLPSSLRELQFKRFR